ncbi:sigma 54-interacting transcriptional regulator [Lapidilactobacillus bayanensis]|uniref:sigma 54-interacting transcriptional regulator n=1 Tax=Lapidilactobacillus bayanensis TaxID=2485998 RepID=UPI000F773830|nr:sigma 54-interacting transcriptional regulator [Lapidilactobacillus bayanensis]
MSDKLNSVEKVYVALQELAKTQSSISTSDLAEVLQLSRSVTSHYLAQLLKEKKVSKTDGRPVKWYLSADSIVRQQPLRSLHAFTNLIGVNGSQRSVVEKCIAAVKYPGNGLNVVITGNSGVGKSFLAQLIAQYARDTKVIASDAPFEVLNCADYANNPELLSSILFGYVKGAFTGANKDHLGLLTRADGGYLFLDEIHRLSGENQEKLFTFMDSGKFRAIGDNQHDQTAKVRMIFATTEDPQVSLLDTFNRRVPITIHLQDYAKRPLDERLEFIKVLFMQEAKKLTSAIQVDAEAVSYLVQLDPVGNIGKIKNLIKVACAKTYANSNKEQLLKIHCDSFDSFTATKSNQTEKLAVGAMLLDPADKIQTAVIYNSKVFEQQVRAVIAELPENNNGLQNVLQTSAFNYVTEQITPLHYLHQRLFNKVLVTKFGVRGLQSYEPIFFNLYQHKVTLSKQTMIELSGKINHGASRAQHIAQAFYTQLPILERSSQQLLQILLTLCLTDEVDETIPTRVLMIAHGSSMATSIQSVVNQLCGTYLVDALDMPIDTTINEIVTKSKQLIDSFDTTKGLILMIDMGSLSQLYRQIKNKIDGDLLVINNLTTATALDIALKVQQKMAFNKIAEHASTEYSISTQYFEGFAENQNIVISCMSGLGISEKLKDIFEEYLDKNVSIITMDFAKLHENVTDNDMAEFQSTLIVITTTNLPGSFEIPNINIYDLLDAAGQVKLESVLKKYVDKKTFDALYNQLVRFLSIEGVTERLSFLNPKVIIQEVETVIFKFENYYHIKIAGKYKLNLYMHISLMVERLMTGMGSSSSSYQIKNNSKDMVDFFTLAKGILRPLEIKYNIQIDDYELSLLYELFKVVIAESKQAD